MQRSITRCHPRPPSTLAVADVGYGPASFLFFFFGISELELTGLFDSQRSSSNENPRLPNNGRKKNSLLMLPPSAEHANFFASGRDETMTQPPDGEKVRLGGCRRLGSRG